MVPSSKRINVAWLDGETVVETVHGAEGERGFVLPSVAVTAALVLPESCALPLVTKDRVQLVMEAGK